MAVVTSNSHIEVSHRQTFYQGYVKAQREAAVAMRKRDGMVRSLRGYENSVLNERATFVFMAFCDPDSSAEEWSRASALSRDHHDERAEENSGHAAYSDL